MPTLYGRNFIALADEPALAKLAAASSAAWAASLSAASIGTAFCTCTLVCSFESCSPYLAMLNHVSQPFCGDCERQMSAPSRASPAEEKNSDSFYE